MKNPTRLALLLFFVPVLVLGAGLTPVQPVPPVKTAPKPEATPKAAPPSAPRIPVPGLWGQNTRMPIQINSATLTPPSNAGTVIETLSLNVTVANIGASPAKPFRIKIIYEAKPNWSPGVIDWAQGLGQGKTDSKTKIVSIRNNYVNVVKDGQVCLLLTIVPISGPLPPAGLPRRVCTAPGALVPPTPLDPDCPERAPGGIPLGPNYCIAPNPLPSNGSSASANVVTDRVHAVTSDSDLARRGYPIGSRLIAVSLALNTNLILPPDAVGVANRGAPHGWLGVGFSGPGVVIDQRIGFNPYEPGLSLVMPLPVLPAGSSSQSAGAWFVLCPSELTTYSNSQVSVTLGYWKRTADARDTLTKKQIGDTTVVLTVDTNTICRAAFATN
ncbi:MAG: hypothetical protein AABY62_02570 [Pseudomonadota bacterium]